MSDTTHPLTDYHLTVDYGQSLPRMIAAGHYDWTNPDITAERFPIIGKGTTPVEARLFHFGHYLSSEDAVAAIKTADARHPWMPATIEHLLAFGATYPDEQHQYPIAALGSVAKVRGFRRVPYLNWFGAERRLNLDLWGGGWLGCYRCLAVRNLPSGA